MFILTENQYKVLNETIPMNILRLLDYAAIILNDGMVKVLKNRFNKTGIVTYEEHTQNMVDYTLQRKTINDNLLQSSNNGF